MRIINVSSCQPRFNGVKNLYSNKIARRVITDSLPKGIVKSPLRFEDSPFVDGFLFMPRTTSATFNGELAISIKDTVFSGGFEGSDEFIQGTLYGISSTILSNLS